MSSCQICGREIKTNKKGLIVRHKNLIRPRCSDGSRCWGTGHPPYESSSSAIYIAIEELDHELTRRHLELADLATDPPLALAELVWGRFGRPTGEVAFFRRPEDFDPANETDPRRHVQGTYACRWWTVRHNLERHIRQGQDTLSYLCKRLGGWKRPWCY